MPHDMSLGDAALAYDDTVRALVRSSLRKPQAARGELPPGTIVVSADNHWSCTQDIFHEAFPKHLKDRAPRWIGGPEGFWEVGGQPVIPHDRAAALKEHEMVPGAHALEPRMRDLDAEGIDKEIVFPNGVAGFYAYRDLEVREWIFRTHNQYLARQQAKAPGRFYGVGLVNYWDMQKARESVQEAKALGLKTVLLPMYPKDDLGRDLDYCSEEMETLWSAIEEAGLPVVYHVGEFAKGGRGALGIGAMVGFGPFRKSLGELIFGGIFDRHPTLQVVFTEADINWVPGALQTATMVYEAQRDFIEPRIAHHPRHYWAKHCYATFIYDPIGMQMLDIVGADRVMWSSDYVHLESSYSYGWDAKQIVLDTVSPDEARMILGGTAMKVFNLD
jgi:predicted TIM-barrel fold metal-dependent hydrolase